MKSSTIECPYCGYKFTDDDINNASCDISAILHQEMSTVESCPRCENRFYIRGSYSPIYETQKMEEVDEE